MNPIFIPRNFRERRNGEEARYRSVPVKGKDMKVRDLRIIEYYDKKGVLYQANVWGICGRLEEFRDRFVAHDRDIDAETLKEIREPAEALYPKSVKTIWARHYML